MYLYVIYLERRKVRYVPMYTYLRKMFLWTIPMWRWAIDLSFNTCSSHTGTTPCLDNILLPTQQRMIEVCIYAKTCKTWEFVIDIANRKPRSKWDLTYSLRHEVNHCLSLDLSFPSSSRYFLAENIEVSKKG